MYLIVYYPIKTQELSTDLEKLLCFSLSLTYLLFYLQINHLQDLINESNPNANPI